MFNNGKVVPVKQKIYRATIESIFIYREKNVTMRQPHHHLNETDISE